MTDAAEGQKERLEEQREKKRKKQFNNTKKLFRKLNKAFATPPDLTVSQWADAYRMLSPEASAEAGRWRTDRAPYQREIMDAVSDDRCYKVVIMSSAQVGKALDVATPIPTPDGFKKMGDLQIGDVVFDEWKNPCNVIGVTGFQYNRECYNFEFSNGDNIVADKEHKWFIHFEDFETVVTTEKLISMMNQGRRAWIKRNLYLNGYIDGGFYVEILSIKPVKSRPVKCIAVDSPSHLYLAGKSMIPTHNTEIILNMIGYHIDYDPAPIMYVLPTDSMAETFSKDRVSPMVRDTPTLKEKVEDVKSRASGNTIFHKKFAGGHLTFVGANTPSQLASRPIRILLADEIDRFPASAGTEGDPLALAIKRTTTFWNRKIIEVSTPTLKETSKIYKEYESSSMEELNISCPNCGKFQPYVWENLKFEHESGTQNFNLLGYKCAHCGEIEREIVWKRQPIKWVAKHPERKEVRGFHLNELASPWKRWEEIVTDFLEAKRQGKQMLQVWHNTALGLPWEEESDLDIKDILLKRRQFYNCQVPQDVVVLTCGVDVQDNRLEYEVVGWGKDKRSWGIKYGVVMGSPGQHDTWKMLDDVLFSNYKRADGLDMQIMTTCIDSGGHFTTEVYNYCKRHEMRRVWAIKGQGGSGIPFIKRPTKRNQGGAFLFMLGVDVGKDTVAARLKTNFPNEAGFCFFPMEIESGYDEQYFEMLTAEKRNVRTVNGRVVINWVKRYEGVRNEAFDLRNYATAALEILNPNLDRLYEKLNNSENSQKNQPTKRKTGAVSKGISVF